MQSWATDWTDPDSQAVTDDSWGPEESGDPTTNQKGGFVLNGNPNDAFRLAF